jgi:hypothetical protein
MEIKKEYKDYKQNNIMSEFDEKYFDFAKFDAMNMNIQDQLGYIVKCFIPLTNNDHIKFKENGDYEIIDSKTLREVYFNRMERVCSDFYFKNNKNIKTLVCEMNKPMFYDNKFNI